MKRALLTLLLVCLLAPDADAGIFRKRRGGFARGGGIRGLLAEARSTMAQANQTMRNAERTMHTAKAMMHDPVFKESMEASERVLKLQIELEKLKAQAKAETP
jgi:hypothetical protein